LDFSDFFPSDPQKKAKEEPYIPSYVQTKPKKGEDSEGRTFVEVVIDDTLKKEDYKVELGTIKDGFKKLKKKCIEAVSDDKEIIISSMHGFVHAAYLAFNHHLPLCFGPDDLWNLIVQGVSVHVKENAEQLRDKFVDFEGKKELMIRRDNFVRGSPKNDWAGSFEEWSKKVSDNIGKENTEILIPKFSTTGDLEKALHELSLMDITKSYFRYKMKTCCGISQVKLMGTLQDWQTLRESVSKLRKYELDWWIDHLEPVIDEIINTYQGKVNKKFWYTIYKEWRTYGSGATGYVTGWITHFFPYVRSRKRSEFCTLTELASGNETRRKSVEDDDVPNGVTNTPFIWDFHGIEIPMNIYGGFAGCEIDGGYVRPVLAWGVGEKPEEVRQNFVKKTMPVEEWNIETVVQYLIESDSHMKNYASYFRERKITGKDLVGEYSPLRRKLFPKGVEPPEGFRFIWGDIDEVKKLCA